MARPSADGHRLLEVAEDRAELSASLPSDGVRTAEEPRGPMALPGASGGCGRRVGGQAQASARPTRLVVLALAVARPRGTVKLAEARMLAESHCFRVECNAAGGFIEKQLTAEEAATWLKTAEAALPLALPLLLDR